MEENEIEMRFFMKYFSDWASPGSWAGESEIEMRKWNRNANFYEIFFQTERSQEAGLVPKQAKQNWPPVVGASKLNS